MIKASDKEALQKFGQNLRKIRDSKNLSLREVSLNCNIDNSKISKIEQRAHKHQVHYLTGTSQRLKVDPSELLKINSD